MTCNFCELFLFVHVVFYVFSFEKIKNKCCADTYCNHKKTIKKTKTNTGYLNYSSFWSSVQFEIRTSWKHFGFY